MKLLGNELFMVLRWIIEYLNHLDQSLPVFNITIINGKSRTSTRIDSYSRKNVNKETINNLFL